MTAAVSSCERMTADCQIEIISTPFTRHSSFLQHFFTKRVLKQTVSPESVTTPPAKSLSRLLKRLTASLFIPVCQEAVNRWLNELFPREFVYDLSHRNIDF